LNKTAYELLLGKNPNVSYFRVFGSKCFILNKKPKNSKFPPKFDEGFLLGYASNAHGYHVFNKTSGCVEVACDMIFHESNGSQGEQVDDVVGMEESPSKAIKKLATGEIKPQEQEDQDDDDVLMFKGSSTSSSAAQTGYSGNMSGDSGSPVRSIRIEDRTIQVIEDEPSTPHQDQSQAEQEVEPIQHEAQVPHPRIHQIIQKDHPVDNILGSISKGVTTRSCLATFYEHYSFVSSLEPLKVEEALDDPDWVMAMQEELNNFTRNEVWSLVERPKQNVIGTKWVFWNRQDEHGVVTRNKARLVAQGFTTNRRFGFW
jgi:hypothetical protein